VDGGTGAAAKEPAISSQHTTGMKSVAVTQLRFIEVLMAVELAVPQVRVTVKPE
jgi:hypothetical protein